MTTSIEILQNYELEFPVRMRALLLFNHYFQKKLDSNENCNELFDLFSSSASILNLTEKINQLSINYSSRIELFLTIVQNISDISARKPIADYLSLGINFLQNNKSDNFAKIWNYQNQSKNEFNHLHIYEQYSVYYVSMYYMDFFKEKQPYTFIVQFFTLFYLQNCFEAFVCTKSKNHLNFSDIIEIYTKTARVYEHSYKNKNLQTTFSILQKKKMTSLPFLLSLI